MSNTQAPSDQDLWNEERLRWRMEAIVRHADSAGLPLEEAAAAFVKVQNRLTKTEDYPI